MKARILVGDCRVRMAELEANSVDSIVTDPPYGLSFMGKEWDHGVPGVEFWKEALRVAKPGAHLLAFGGTRTYHRLAVAIEDAGWEIRDCLSWLYGSGFPKSLDVSKAIDRGFRKDEGAEAYTWKPSSGPNVDVYTVTAFVRAARDAAGKKNREIDALFGFHGMAGHWTSSTSQPSVPTWPQWEQLKAFLGMGDEMDELVVTINGGKGDRSIENTALAEREIVGQHESAPAAQTWKANYGLDADLRAKAKMGGAATEAGKFWAGWGTALKPAWEPIILARKSPQGTVAACVLAHGTGALNIGATRIGTEGGTRMEGGPNGKSFSGGWGGGGSKLYEGGLSKEGGDARPVEGRWPANVTLDEEAAALLDEQSGETRSVSAPRGGTSPNPMSWGGGRADGDKAAGFGDFGGASRFFYTAKAAAAERADGLEGKNAHPTVKPVALMAWLCRLVTRPGGLVLDPFTGSGSTGVAALAAGFDFVGCELSPEYAAIAEARVSNVAPMFAEVEKDEEPEEEKQMGLEL